MTPIRLFRTTLWVALVGGLAVVCMVFWPANLGGRTTYVTTHGTSMLPRFHAGDLAIVQPAAHYGVGDIAAYRSATVHAVVLHRIVAIKDGRFSFRGDHNDFTDPDHPTMEAIVGRLAARLPHGGAIRAALGRPMVLLPLIVVSLGAFFWVPLTGGSRRRKRSGARVSGGRAARRSPPAWRRFGEVSAAVLLAAALATGGTFVVMVTVWLLPRSEAATGTRRYVQNATLGYSGSARPGAVYPDGRIRTGDPVFTRMVSGVTMQLAFSFATPDGARHSVHGTSQVLAEVSSATGWQRELALSPVRVFAGDRMHDAAKLNLGALRRIQEAFTAETGLDSSTVSLQIVWNLHVAGTIEGARIDETSRPQFDFQLTPVELLPQFSTANGGRVQTSATVVKKGSIGVPTQRAHELSLLRAHLSIGRARLLALVLFALVLAASAIAIDLDRRRSARGQAAGIVARHGYLLVKAESIPLAGDRPIVHVDSMADLARLAKLHEELIVHAEELGCHRFALFTEAVVYLYAVGAPHPALPDPQVEKPVEKLPDQAVGGRPNDDELAKWALARLEERVAVHQENLTASRGGEVRSDHRALFAEAFNLQPVDAGGRVGAVLESDPSPA
jgi:signal peptidase I